MQAPTPPVTIQRLFDVNRCPNGIALLPILLYAPLGLVLVLVRICIGIHTYIIACVLSKMSLLRCIVLRVMCGVLGILVKECGEKPTSRAVVIVANYSSTLDHVALELLIPNNVVSVWDLPSALMWLLGYHDMGAQQGQDTLITNIQQHCRDSKIPLLAFPESATTNGKVGLLKYSVWPFSLDMPVQPVVIQIVRPSLFSISPSVLGRQWLSDIFWFLFVPYTLFRIRYLEPQSQTDDETPQEFCRRVQTLMAKELGVVPTSFTSADKVDLVRQLFDSKQTQNYETPERHSTDSHMDSMVNQVKVVLPHVPSYVIRMDLELTKDIDLTITNILEGRVEFVACEPSVMAERSGNEDRPEVRRADVSCSRPTVQPATSSNASKTFSKSSSERQISFEERKKAMLETARRRYLNKESPKT